MLLSLGKDASEDPENRFENENYEYEDYDVNDEHFKQVNYLFKSLFNKKNSTREDMTDLNVTNALIAALVAKMASQSLILHKWV